jgi:hypothetical protein
MAVALGALLAMVYLLSFSGQFRSIDEYAMYARAETLAQGYGTGTPQLAFSSLHHPVGALEPGQSVLAAPLYLLARQWPAASNITAVMLFNVFVTALTGALLYGLIRGLGFGQVVAALTTLAWGIGTTAWPYARSFFREPLLALFWLGAACACLRWQRTRRVPWGLACLALAAGSLAVKISAAGALPVFALALLWDARRKRLALTWRRALLLGAVALIAGAAVAALYALRYDKPLSLAEYTWGYPWGQALAAAYGLLISPVKGIAFFSPILIGGAIGWPGFFRRQGPAAWLTLGLVLSLLYIYGPAPQWHGGHVVWGPRFVVPLLPLLILPYATALANPRLVARLWVAGWSVVGLVIQFVAGTASWSDAIWQLVPAYQGEWLVGLDGIPWQSWRLLPRSPALVQLTGWGVRQLDLSWLRTLSDGTLAYDLPLGVGLVALALVVAGAVWLLLARRSGALRHQRLVALACALAVLAGSGGLLTRSARNTQDHGGLTRAEAQQMASLISQAQDAPYTVALISNDFFIHFMPGLLKGRFLLQWHSPHEPLLLSEVMARAPRAERVWLVVDRVHLPVDATPYLARDAFVREGYLMGSQWVGGYELFAFLPPAPLERQPVARSWENGLVVRALAADAQELRPGEALRVELELAAAHPLAEDYVLFVHLLPAEGPALAAPDGQPQYGGAPTSAWQPGQAVVDRRAILIPQDAAPGVYELGCGWLDAQGARVAPVEGQGPTRDGMIVLGTVVISEP